MGDEVRVQKLDSQTEELLDGLHKERLKFARFGDIGFFLPESYKKDADNIKNMTVRPDDVWVVTFPRSGTTWTQELVWLLMNNFDYDTASKLPLRGGRYLFLEAGHVIPNNEMKTDGLDPKLRQEIIKSLADFKTSANAPSPRFIKTHLPFSMLPSKLLDTTKVVYVARDPRDVAVSFYHMYKVIVGFKGDFKSFWNILIEDLVLYSPFFSHLKEAWALRDHPNMFFIFYEEMIKDLAGSIKRIADFFGKEATHTQIDKLCQHLHIKNFRKNESVNPSWKTQINPDAEGFVRKGKSGAWRENFDEGMASQAQRWMCENLANTDLRFPDASSNLYT